MKFLFHSIPSNDKEEEKNWSPRLKKMRFTTQLFRVYWDTYYPLPCMESNVVAIWLYNFLHHSRLICTTRDIQLLKKRLSTTFLSFLLLSAVMDRWWWPTNEWMEQKHIKIKEEFIVKIFFAGRSIFIPLHLLS